MNWDDAEKFQILSPMSRRISAQFSAITALRTGHVSVVIRGFVHYSWYGPALERLSWAGTSYIARDRYLTERVFLRL
jgi:hypothetical protein